MAKKTGNKKLAVGAGVAALAAAAAGVYLLSGKRGAKNRKKLGGWVSKTQKEVVKELTQARASGQKGYNQAVAKVAGRYKNLKNIDRSEILQMMNELKGHWKSIAKQLQKPITKTKKRSGKRK